jgi:hypothetical protein
VAQGADADHGGGRVGRGRPRPAAPGGRWLPGLGALALGPAGGADWGTCPTTAMTRGHA